MPRNVRNFWVDLDVDGRRTRVATGPVRKDGGFTLTVYQRSEGDIVRPLEIRGVAHADGTLSLRVERGVGRMVEINDRGFRYITRR